ncbi:MAG: BON domain-containing protein, partial [Candidatus Dormibacteraeota bacterium]|nr:BON domain-containing protein [Candidatus Dormibacteraeota bacterium]
AEAVRGALHDAFGAEAEATQVSSHHGTVTLRGEVQRLNDIDAYEACARSVDPRDVNNLLRLAVAHREASPLTSAQ